MQRWTLSVDGAGGTFPLNPKQGALPSFQRQYTVQGSSLGSPVIFEAPLTPQVVSFTGTILEKDHYDFFVDWFNSNSICVLTDDNDQTFTGVLQRFTPKRRNLHTHPWASDYEIEVLVWAGSDF